VRTGICGEGPPVERLASRRAIDFDLSADEVFSGLVRGGKDNRGQRGLDLGHSRLANVADGIAARRDRALRGDAARVDELAVPA
jgi:hypothetical protein